MTDVFLSYGRGNVEFVQQLKDDLEGLRYSTWMDNDRLKGGNQWISEIEASLNGCKIFLVVVSKVSNASNWVRRETIRAEQLEKVRIPLLLDDCDLPLWLLDVQYIDFRESYKHGLEELSRILESTLRLNGESSASGTTANATRTPVLQTTGPSQSTSTAWTKSWKTEDPSSSNKNNHNPWVPRTLLEQNPSLSASSSPSELERYWQSEANLTRAMEHGDMYMIYVSQRLIHHQSTITLDLAKQLAGLLSEAHHIFRFINDQCTKMTGSPQPNCYYNLACILSLLVELELRVLQDHHGDKTLQHQQAPRASSSNSLLEMAQRLEAIPAWELQMRGLIPLGQVGKIGLPGKGQDTKALETTTKATRSVGEMLQAQLQASKTCMQLAIACGWTNMAHLQQDRDLLALKELNP